EATKYDLAIAGATVWDVVTAPGSAELARGIKQRISDITSPRGPVERSIDYPTEMTPENRLIRDWYMEGDEHVRKAFERDGEWAEKEIVEAAGRTNQRVNAGQPLKR